MPIQSILNLSVLCSSAKMMNITRPRLSHTADARRRDPRLAGIKLATARRDEASGARAVADAMNGASAARRN